MIYALEHPMRIAQPFLSALTNVCVENLGFLLLVGRHYFVTYSLGYQRFVTECDQDGRRESKNAKFSVTWAQFTDYPCS